ncbi:MAG: peptidoglycan-binding domain-containing protein, partial [Henriciella sp.]
TKHIKVEGLNLTQTMDDGSEATINQVSIWLDPEYYVRRKIRMDGTIKRGRKSEPFFMERENQDYRRVDDTYLYEPYREVMKIGGMMTDKQRRELAKAQSELEKAKAQLAQMPPAQRAMVEGMMASQMAQLDNLVDNGAATVEVITTEIEINPGFADTLIITLGGSAHSETLVRMIQTDLAKLGFEPGPATGTISKATSDAISAYQASRNMPVNGAPSPELAAALQAEASAL